jgi:hypothetical protein
MGFNSYTLVRWTYQAVGPTDVGVVVDEPEVVAPLSEAQVEVVVHEMEFHSLSPFYLIPWRHGVHVVRQSA